MIERLIDDWLSNANERSYQYPFAHALAGQGYEVVHVTRHCGMELGKDILAKDRHGFACAFQLKDVRGKKISLRQWTADLAAQIVSLVETAIVHPALPAKGRSHRSIVVINGELEEEVIRWIDDFNRGRPSRGGRPSLEVITKGTMITWMKELNTNFWPKPISEIKPVIELWLDDGGGQLNKPVLAAALEQVLELERAASSVTTRGIVSAIHATAITTSFAIASFTQKKNHFAEFEAWMLAYAHCCAFVEKSKSPYENATQALSVIEKMIWNSVALLVEEARDAQDLCLGDPFTDSQLHRVRATAVVGVAALATLWASSASSDETQLVEQSRVVVERYFRDVWMWGEGACPQLLALYLYQRCFSADVTSDVVLGQLVEGFCRVAGDNARLRQFGTVYQTFEDVFFPEQDTNEEHERATNTNFRSRCVKAFWHLLVKENWKQRAKAIWPDLSKLVLEEFTPSGGWRAYQWRAEKGTLRTVLQQRRQQWSSLSLEACTIDSTAVPKAFIKNPALYLAFLIAYPHRWTTDGVKWLVATASAAEQRN